MATKVSAYGYDLKKGHGQINLKSVLNIYSSISFDEGNSVYHNDCSKFVDDKKICQRLGTPWLNWRFSLALTVCMLRALFFVSSQFVNCVGCFLVKITYI